MPEFGRFLIRVHIYDWGGLLISCLIMPPYNFLKEIISLAICATKTIFKPIFSPQTTA